MRDDAILNTGVTSATANKLERVKQKELERKDKKIEKRAKLMPAADIFNEEIDKEIKKTILTQLDLGEDTNQETLRLYKKSMQNLKSRISTIMRKPDNEQEEE